VIDLAGAASAVLAMTPKIALLSILGALTGCYDPGSVSPDTDANGSGTSGGSGDASSGETSDEPPPGTDGTGDTDGPGCGSDADCVDVDICSIDTCEDGACVHTPDVDDPQCTCTTPADCTLLPADDACRTRTCEEGVCGLELAPADTPLHETRQTAEDCQRMVCDGAGEVHSIVDDADVPVDGLECTSDLCTDGVPENPPAEPGTACAAGECDAAGACIGCDEPSDCGGTSTFCEAVTCEAQMCGIATTPSGTELPDQTSGDCQRLECDGRGNSAAVAEDADVPADDGNDCTEDTCVAGQAAHPPRSSGTACTSNGGSVCDGAGTCVECTQNSQCGGGGGCMLAACMDNACTLVPNTGAACDDGLFCTEVDTCNAQGTCVGSGDPCPGADGDGDCSEGCNETANSCTGLDASGSPCNDGQFCTANDTCNASGTCVGSGNPCPGADGDMDCSETCNESANACTGNDPNGSDCGGCRTCSSGTCNYLCSPLGMCCPGFPDQCVSQGQSCQ
jgi:hypothetical protein